MSDESEPLPPGVERGLLWPTAPEKQVSKRFLVVAIDRAQRGSVEDTFVSLLNDFIHSSGRLAWDDQRGLFWVNHPHSGWQVALWLMPVAEVFSPTQERDAVQC